MPKLLPPAPNHQATPTTSAQPNQLTPISEHTSLIKKQATPTGDNNIMSASVIEHKRHVSEAVSNLHSGKKTKHLKKKKLYREKIQDMEDDNTSPPEMNGKATEKKQYTIGIMNHVPFTAEPHPLLTSENIASNSNSNNNGFGPNADVSRGPLGRPTRAGSAIGVATARGAGMMVGLELDEEHEYFTELVDNINRKQQYSSLAVSYVCIYQLQVVC